MAGTGDLWLGAINKITYYSAFFGRDVFVASILASEPFFSLILIASGAYLSYKQWIWYSRSCISVASKTS